MTDQNLFTFIIVAVSIMVLLALSILLIFNSSQRRILKEESINQQKEIEFQKKMVESIIETQENERHRISRELHDGIGSKLNVISLNLNLLLGTDQSSDEGSMLIERIKKMLSESISSTREISHSLFPPVLDKFGIQNALKSIASDINRSGALEVFIDFDDNWESMNKLKELHLYRIIQELLNNTIKHAQAKQVNIFSSQNSSELKIIYSDDGKGFDDMTQLENGSGMQNIKSRTELLSASYEVVNNKNNGMEVQIKVPLNQNS